MAYNDSDELDPRESFILGDYLFNLEVDSTTGMPYIEVIARCTDVAHNKTATKIKQFNQETEITGWYVETNETEASVYAVIQQNDPEQDSKEYEGGGINAILISFSKEKKEGSRTSYYYPEVLGTRGDEAYTLGSLRDTGEVFLTRYNEKLYARRKSGTNDFQLFNTDGVFRGSTTYKTVTDEFTAASWSEYITNVPESTVLPGTQPLHPSGPKIESEVLIARFAIDIGKADGGPDGNWDEPGDYDPEEDPIEWGDPDYPDPDDPNYPEPIEPGEPGYPDPDDPDYPGDEDGDGELDPYHPPYYPPQKTLYLTVTGATAGTHIADSIPLPNEQKADYGCGGDGGHGGGGGAGASTVVVYRIATNKASSHEVVAIAKRHGYGSGGGKGGKGGNGCILIYY